jgi:pantoate kinase
MLPVKSITHHSGRLLGNSLGDAIATTGGGLNARYGGAGARQQLPAANLKVEKVKVDDFNGGGKKGGILNFCTSGTDLESE